MMTLFNRLLLAGFLVAELVCCGRLQPACAQETVKLKIGMIGLDTSHAPAFTKLFNADNAAGPLARMKVVAAYPGGSPDLPSSRDRIENFTNQLEELGVKIVGSIPELLEQVDVVLLESVDGRKHLEQVLPVFKAGKPVFIDKPLAAGLTDAICIHLLGQKYDAKWFTSSSLRFSPSIIKHRSASAPVQGAAAWSPCSMDETHADLFWYGVHGVETLYTAMGQGCKTVSRVHLPGVDLVVGQWPNGRIGTFRGIRDGKAGYGLVVFGNKTIESDGKYEGYAPLVDEIAKFFAGGSAPVSNDESLEIMTFMETADVSKARNGASVELSEVWHDRLTKARNKLAKIDPSKSGP